jgi:hypothetical protein
LKEISQREEPRAEATDVKRQYEVRQVHPRGAVHKEILLDRKEAEEAYQRAVSTWIPIIQLIEISGDAQPVKVLRSSDQD